MATLRNLAIGVLKTLGANNIAKNTRAIRDEPQRALPILGITNDPGAYRIWSSPGAFGGRGPWPVVPVWRVHPRAA